MELRGPSHTAINTAMQRASHLSLDDGPKIVAEHLPARSRDMQATPTGWTSPGSEIVLQFVVPPATLASDEAALVEALAERARQVGQPWISFYHPVDIERHLLDAGFGRIAHFDPEEATARYLQGRGGGLRLPAYFRTVHARLLSRAST